MFLYHRMLSVVTHSLHLKMIRSLATSAMTASSVSSASTTSLLPTTPLIQLRVGKITIPYSRGIVTKPLWSVLVPKSEVCAFLFFLRLGYTCMYILLIDKANVICVIVFYIFHVHNYTVNTVSYTHLTLPTNREV